MNYLEKYLQLLKCLSTKYLCVGFCFSKDLLFVFIFFDKSLTFWQIWWTTQKSSQLLRSPQRRLPGCRGPGPGMQDFTHFPSNLTQRKQETAITRLRTSSGSRRPAGGRRVLAQADPGCPGWRGGAARAWRAQWHRTPGPGNTAPLHPATWP